MCQKNCEPAMQLAFLYFCLYLAPPLLVCALSGPEPLVVSLTSGTFKGTSSGSPNNTEKWLGIPFAEPPIGNLRFKAPTPIIKPSNLVKDASQFGDACPQEPSATLGAPMSEDCLKLNVGPVFNK